MASRRPSPDRSPRPVVRGRALLAGTPPRAPLGSTKALILGLLLLPGSAPGSRAGAQSLPDDLSEAAIKTFVSEQNVGSVAELVSALPPLHKRHFVTLWKSASPAADIVDEDSPRVVSWGVDARFILAWTQDGPEEVEFLEQKTDRWEAGLIDFATTPPTFSHPTTCASCHGALERPIWGEEKWEGTASSTESLDRPDAPQEELDLRAHVLGTDHPRLQPLDRRWYGRSGVRDAIGISIPGSVFEEVNWNLSTQLSLRHGEVLYNRLRARSDYLTVLRRSMTDSWPDLWIGDLFLASRNTT